MDLQLAHVMRFISVSAVHLSGGALRPAASRPAGGTRLLVALLAICIVGLGVVAPARAALVSTDEVLAEARQGDARARLAALLARDEVRAGLVVRGVEPDEAAARAAALSDAEAQALAGKLDRLPAGAGFVEAVVAIFLVLLLTDILGFTKVYSFTRPAK